MELLLAHVILDELHLEVYQKVIEALRRLKNYYEVFPINIVGNRRET